MNRRGAGHQISEVSARTGFSASALRYYEGVGLLEPDRTPAGYRIYDDRDVERLRFVARAKDLGLGLDEIAELLPIWDGRRCAEVAGRLAERVDEKLEQTRVRIVELRSFAAELRATRHRLAADAVDGPCGDTCACSAVVRSTDSTTTVVADDSGAKPPMGGRVPIVCTLTSDGAVDRLDAWSTLVAARTGPAQRRTDATTASVTVTFAPDPALAARVAELAAAEQVCCSFIDFAISIDRTGTRLTARTSSGAASVIDALMGLEA